MAPGWAYFQFFRISACISLVVFHGFFVVVAGRRPEQLVQLSELVLSRSSVSLQSRCSRSLGSLASLCHTQVRKLSGPCKRLAEASELALPGGAERLFDWVISYLMMDLHLDLDCVLLETCDKGAGKLRGSASRDQNGNSPLSLHRCGQPTILWHLTRDALIVH